ncbi:hypothetical protein D3C84_527480 [compost metagenome]
MIDVRALECHDIGNQTMLGTELLILLGGHRGAVVPAERFQCLFDEFIRLLFGQAPLGFGAFNEVEGGRGKNRASVEHRLGERPQFKVFNQFQAQQRGEHPERADLQRRFMHRAKSRGMHRHPGRRQVVITHRLHAHHRKQSGECRQFIGGANADRTVALQVQAFDFTGAVQVFRHLRVAVQHVTVGLLHQCHQRAVQGHFLAIHVRHRFGKALADQVWADEARVVHEQDSWRVDVKDGRKDRSLPRRLQTKILTNFILQRTASLMQSLILRAFRTQ